jgi:hypothetical protein
MSIVPAEKIRYGPYYCSSTMDRRLVKCNPACHKSTKFVKTTILPWPS